MKIVQIRPIVLASGSPRRKDYLERYNLQFKIITGDIEEIHGANEEPIDFSQRMAKEKADVVKNKCNKKDVVIAADTIVVHEGHILGKPKSENDVFPMLKALNGNHHQVITSYVIMDCMTGESIQNSVTTDVYFNLLDESVLKAYADSTEPRDKAGSYSIQGIGTLLVKEIKGSYNNVVGLPIECLLQDLLTIKAISI